MYLFETWRILCETYHTFVVQYPGDFLDPEFTRQFSDVMAAFDTFTQQVLIVFSGVNPGDNTRSHLTTAPLYVTGENLMLEWAKFINRTNIVFKNGMIPHRRQLAALFKKLLNGMGKVTELVSADRLRTDAAAMVASILSKLLGRIRNETTDVMARRRTERFKDFDLGMYKQMMADAIKTMTDLFDHQMPKFSLAAGISMQIKAEMVYACSRMAAVMEGASLLDKNLSALKNDMVLFNAELNAVHKRLRLPFVVGLGIDTEEEEEEEGDIET